MLVLCWRISCFEYCNIFCAPGFQFVMVPFRFVIIRACSVIEFHIALEKLFVFCMVWFCFLSVWVVWFMVRAVMPYSVGVNRARNIVEFRAVSGENIIGSRNIVKMLVVVR